MKFTKIISSLLALGALLMLLSACQNIKKTPLVLFESLSFGMSPKSVEERFGKASEVEEEKETAYTVAGYRFNDNSVSSFMACGGVAVHQRCRV